MHTRMDPFDFHLWLAILSLQFAVGLASRGFMRAYLIAYAIIGSAALGVARLASWQEYIVAYRAYTILGEAVSLFAILAIVNLVRLHGLPGRRFLLPIQIMIGISFSFGIRSASSALTLLKSPTWRLLLSWDQAFQVALCVLIGLIPIYVVYVSASLPNSLILKTISFGAYSAASAGALDHFIIFRTASHLADFVYIGSLLVWFIAARADRTTYPALTALELGDSQCEG